MASTGILGAGLLILVGASAYNIYAITSATGSDDNKSDMKKALTITTIVNIVLVLIFGMIAVAYIASNPTAERPYIIMVTHFSLLLSIIAASAAAIQKLDLSTVNLSSSTAASSGCPK